MRAWPGQRGGHLEFDFVRSIDFGVWLLLRSGISLGSFAAEAPAQPGPMRIAEYGSAWLIGMLQTDGEVKDLATGKRPDLGPDAWADLGPRVEALSRLHLDCWPGSDTSELLPYWDIYAAQRRARLWPATEETAEFVGEAYAGLDEHLRDLSTVRVYGVHSDEAAGAAFPAVPAVILGVPQRSSVGGVVRELGKALDELRLDATS